jgi:hypothetical protein
LYVVEVSGLQYKFAGGSYKDITGTLYVAKGETVTFMAVRYPASAPSWPPSKPVWGGTSGASGTGGTTSVTFDTASSSTTDYKTVTASNCGSTVTCNVVVCPVKVTAGDTFKKDEIFDVTIDAQDTSYTGTMNITLWEGIVNETLGTRGGVQMYDFGYDVDNDGDIDPQQTSITLVAGDNGTKTFKAVFNFAPQTATIKVTDTSDSSFFGVTRGVGIKITDRVRQYAEEWTGGSNPNLNDKDNIISSQVSYWSDWHLGSPAYSLGYTMPEDAVKAVMFKESSMIVTDLMGLTTTAINGMTSGTALHDWNWNAEPLDSGPHEGYYVLSECIPYMNYTGVSDSTEQDSVRWGIRWLYRNRRTYTYHDSGPHEGYCSNPGYNSWEETFEKYGDPTKPCYGEAVDRLYQYGENLDVDDCSALTPATLWPILTNGKPRDE